MPIFQNTNVKVSALGGGQFQVQAGPDGFVTDARELRDFALGRRKDREHLFHQIGFGLDAIGAADLTSMTPAQLKAAIEALTVKW